MNILNAVLFGAALLASSSAVAGRSAQSFGVRLVVEDACEVDAARYLPNPLQQVRDVAAAPAAGVEVTCKGASPYAVDVAVGAVPMPSMAPAAGDARTLVVTY